MSLVSEGLNARMKRSSSDIVLFVIKLLSGLFVGSTFSLVLQTMIGYGQFLFIFVIVALTLLFLRLVRNLRFIGLIIFNLLFILGGLLLRMYILMAPGS